MIKSRMIDVPIGSRQGPVKFIHQLTVAEPAGNNFELELPGKVFRCEGKTVLLSVLPYGRLVLTGGEVVRTATISAEVIDDAGLDRALAELAAEFTTIEAFAIRFASDRHSYGDVVDAAEAASSSDGCCKGCRDGVADVYGSIRVGITGPGYEDCRWTAPVRTVIKTWTADDNKYVPFDPAVTFAASDDDYCDSEWWCDWPYRNRTTTCHGSGCTAPEICACMEDEKGRTHTACDGWRFCWCM